MPDSLPLVTFAVMCYNQEEYIQKAIEGAFAQTYARLQIIISDDSSRDRTFAIAQEMANAYTGPHEVLCIRNEKNIGIAEHVNKVNRLAKGELIVVAAGDDISVPERTARIVDAYLASASRINYFYSSAKEMSLDGRLGKVVVSPGGVAADSKLATALCPYPLAIGATQGWTKVLVNAFPPLGRQVWAEDQVLGLRGRLMGSICYIDEPLVHYRVGSGISTSKKRFTIKSYFRGKWAGVRIYRQRRADAWHSGHAGIATAIAGKAMLLTLAIPFSPVVAVGRKLLKR